MSVGRYGSSLNGGQLLQGIGERHTERLEMTLVGRQNGQTVRGRGRRYSDVLETGIVSTRSIEDQAGMPRLLDAERQDTTGIEMLHRRQPAARLSAFVVASILTARAMPASISAMVMAER